MVEAAVILLYAGLAGWLAVGCVRAVAHWVRPDPAPPSRLPLANPGTRDILRVALAFAGLFLAAWALREAGGCVGGLMSASRCTAAPAAVGDLTFALIFVGLFLGLPVLALGALVGLAAEIGSRVRAGRRDPGA